MPVFAVLASLLVQDPAPPEYSAPARPMIECSEHLNDGRALNSCLDGLLDTAGDQLDDALEAARTEAAEIDLDLPGLANATAHLDRAHSTWTAYRDAECQRRASLLMIGDDGEAIALDCRISMTRARTTELREQ
jgi:uncharacterized protein YecT (DUF1311 family)